MELGGRIRSFREKSGYTQEDLARKLGTTKQTIYKYENGIVTNIPLTRIEQLALALNVSVDSLMGWTSGTTHSLEKGSLRIPVLGRIPAGVPLEAIEEVIDWEEISPDMARGGKQYFALQIKGDSMEPEYLDGDVIIVLKQEDAETGEDVVVMVNGYDATFKRISKVEDGIILRPINPKYEPMPFSAADIQNFPVKVLGVCVELRRKKR